MTTKQDLCIAKRDDIAYKLTVTDTSGTAKDITNYTFYLTVKADTTDDSGSDASALIKITKNTHTGLGDDPTNGITYLRVDRLESTIAAGDYYYDMRYVDDTGEWTTFLYGRFKVRQDITEAA